MIGGQLFVRIHFTLKSPPYAFNNCDSQLTFTCSKSTIETQEKVAEYANINNKNDRMTSMT